MVIPTHYTDRDFKTTESLFDMLKGIALLSVGGGLAYGSLKGLQKRVLFLGYRSDIAELYKSADICIFPSYREGLSVALMEAMCCGLPCIVSRIRGNIDLIDENGGKLFEPSNASSCAHCIEDIDGLRKMGEYNKSKVHKFDVSVVMDLMNKIY